MNRLVLCILCSLLLTRCTSTKESRESETSPVNSPATSPAGEPWLITADDGSVYMSWIETRDSINELRYSKFNNPDWTSPTTIASGKNWFVNWADYPMIAVNGQNVLAHYLDKSGDGTFAYDVAMAHSSDNGVTWSTSLKLNDDGKEAEHGFVSIVPYEENFLVAWLDGRNTVMEGMDHHEGHHGQMSLRAAVINKDGMKSKEWALDERTCDCCQTSAAITPKGPVVVYRDRSRGEVRDISIVRLINGSWTTPKTIYADNWKIEGCPVNGPRIYSMGNTLAVAWFTMIGNKSRVSVIFSKDNGETFGSPVQIDEGSAIGRVDIVMLDEQNAVVSWMEKATIKAVKVGVDGVKGLSVTIASSSESRSSGFPQMTKLGDQLMFAWTDDKSKTINVRLARF